MLWAEPNLLFLLWARHAENTREREKRSERLANNVIETDPLLPGKYWTHKYELHSENMPADIEKILLCKQDCCLSFDTGVSWFSSGGSLGTMFCVFCKLQVRTLRCCRSELWGFLSSNYVQINTFLAPSDTKMVRAVTMWQHSPDKEYWHWDCDGSSIYHIRSISLHFLVLPHVFFPKPGKTETWWSL